MATTATLAVAISARGAVAGARRYNAAMKSMAATTLGAQGAMGGMRTMALKLFAAIGGLMVIKTVTSVIIDFQDSMAELAGVTGATEEQMKQFEETARQLGATTRFTAAEAGEGLINLSRAGLDLNESIAAIEPTLNLATAAQMELGQASRIVTASLNQFQLGADQAERVADTLAFISNKTATNVKELAQGFSFAGATGAALGSSIEETGAALGILADNAQIGSRGGMVFRQMMAELIDPTTKMQAQLQKMGIQFQEVNPVRVGFVGALERLKEAGFGIEEAYKLFNSRVAQGAEILVRNVDEIQKLRDATEKAEGVTKRFAKLMEATLGGALKELKSTIQEVALIIGEAGFAEAVETAIRNTTQLIRVLAGIKTKSEDVSDGVLRMASALKTAWGYVLALKNVFIVLIAMKLTVMFVGVANALWGMATAASSAAISFLSMAGSILTMLLPAIAALMVAWFAFEVGKWIAQFAPVQKFMQKLIEGFLKGWALLKKVWKSTWAVIKSLFITIFVNPILTAFDFVMDTVFLIVNKAAAKVPDAIGHLPGMADTYKDLSKVIAATATGFKTDLMTDTIVEDAREIEAEYQKALKSAEENTERVFKKIEAGQLVQKKTLREILDESINGMVTGMGLFGTKANEAKDEIARLRAEMEANGKLTTEGAQQAWNIKDAWESAKNSVISYGTEALKWLGLIGDKQDTNTTKAEQFKITWEDVNSTLSGGLTDLTMGAKSFNDAVNDITQSLIRMALQKAFEAALTPSTPAVAAKGMVAMASGGIVRGPTPALIGEAGPEAVIPLSRNERGELGLSGGQSAGPSQVSFNMYSPDARGMKSMLLRDPKLIQQMNQVYKQGYAIG